MKRAILPNFGFEYEISARDVPRPAIALETRFATLLRLVPGWRDAHVVTEGPVDELLPWGWSERAAAFCPGHVDVDVIRTVNSKCFSHTLERQLEVVLPDARLIDSLEEAERAAQRLDRAWIIKHPFGVAGRDQVRGIGWNDELCRRVAKLLGSCEEAVFEPQLAVESEFSVHVDCNAAEPRVVGVVGLLTDRSGTFRGNTSAATVRTQVLDVAIDAARKIADTGYRGPLGIDGFRTRRTVRPISEINARWTFGRLTIECSRILGRKLVWHHGPARDRPANLREVTADATAGCWLLPDWCDPEGSSGTWIELVEHCR